VLYGSYYYVDKKYQGRGFAYRIRDEVSFSYIGSRTLCVDSVDGPAAESNRRKFGCVDGFHTERQCCTAEEHYDISDPDGVTIVAVSDHVFFWS